MCYLIDLWIWVISINVQATIRDTTNKPINLALY